jgi:hypothetical protein
MIFYAIILVKPYVKRFIENNYGNPVDFRKSPRENEMIKRMLKKPVHQHEKMYDTRLLRQSEVVEVMISDFEFYHYGWEISKTDTIAFGKYFEKNAKYLMRTVVGLYVSFGVPVEKAINMFQERFNLEEEYWPYDSIKKDFYRLRTKNDLDLSEYAFKHLDRLIRINMSNAGIICEKRVKNG